MAVHWSTSAIFNPNYGFFEEIDLDKQFSNQLTPRGYNSDFVVDQIGKLWKIPITFDWKNYNSTPEYLWLEGIQIPAKISWLPNSLWYIRSAAYSIAESFAQLQNMSEVSITNDQLLEMIFIRVIELFQEEIQRIESYMNQENVVLMPDLLKKFESHLKVLEYYKNVFTDTVWWLKAENIRQEEKWQVESIMDWELKKAA